MTRTRIMFTVLAAMSLLAGCGGSSNNSNAPVDDGLTQQQRDDRAASANVAGLLTLANTIVATLTSDSSEPRAIDGITPAVADDADPATL